MFHAVCHAVSTGYGADACVAVASVVEVFVLVLETKASGADATVLASAFDALVAILVETGEVFPHDLLPGAYVIALVEVLKGRAKSADSLLMEFVLVTLQVAKLSKLLVAIVKATGEGLSCGVNNLVCSYIAALSKRLAAELTAIRTFASVTTLMCLEVSELRETLTTTRLFAYERLDASMCPCVDLEMCLLVK
jgi:hypothetical protein